MNAKQMIFCWSKSALKLFNAMDQMQIQVLSMNCKSMYMTVSTTLLELTSQPLLMGGMGS